MIGICGFPRSPNDNQRLRGALGQADAFTDQVRELSVIDHANRGYCEGSTRVRISGTLKGRTVKEIIDRRRRSTIIAEVRQKKIDGRLFGFSRKDTIGNAVYAVPNACSHNMRKVLVHARAWLAWMHGVLWIPELPSNRRSLTAVAA